VVYRSWKQVVRLAERCRPTVHAEKRILTELTTYLRGLMTMQNHTSNLVYVVSLGSKMTHWSAPLMWRREARRMQGCQELIDVLGRQKRA
jgi:hypothetical protein